MPIAWSRPPASSSQRIAVPKPDPLSTVDSLLRETHATLGEFLTAIRAERQSLKGDTSIPLAETTQRKAALATRLADIESRRDALLGASGLPTGRKGIDAWLQAMPPTARQEARGTWKSVQARAAEAKKENDLNGKLIAAHLQHNEQALGILLGETGDAATYGANGQRSTRAGRRPLGSA